MGAQRLMLVTIFSSGISLLGTHKYKILSEGCPQLGTGQTVAQLEMSLPWAVAQLRMSFWIPETSVCSVILKWGLPSSKYKQTGSSQIRDEPFGRQFSYWGWAMAVAWLGMSLSEGICSIRDEHEESPGGECLCDYSRVGESFLGRSVRRRKLVGWLSWGPMSRFRELLEGYREIVKNAFLLND